MNLINALLAFDPTQRLSLAEVKHHPWVKGKLPTIDEVRLELQTRL